MMPKMRFVANTLQAIRRVHHGESISVLFQYD
jgi:phosphoribosylpyrophosphate synthetase